MYKPVQPGITKSVRSVRYIEISPPQELAELVHCFWELKTDTALPEDFVYHILPDVCVDIIFDVINLNVITIMTPHTTSEELNLGRAFHYVGIRLLPGVWQNDLEQIVGGSIEVNNIGSQLSEDIYSDLRDSSFESQCETLTKITQTIHEEKLINSNPLIKDILSKLDEIDNVETMANVTGYSARQLQRTIKQATGFSPHDFLKVLRLQQSFGQNYLASYYDQAHYIHSFRKITGYTPKKYKKTFDV